jgi:hypothetical protein
MKTMNLDYSFNSIDTLIFSGRSPVCTEANEKILVNIEGTSDSPFPACLREADLLSYGDFNGSSHGYTLLLTYVAGRTPPSNTPCKIGEWQPVPDSLIFGQIRIALPSEAISLIQRDSATNRLTLTICDAVMHNVTK